MRRVREGILSEQDPGGPQDSPHGGIAAQVSRMRQELQSEKQPEDTPPDAHGHQALPLRLLRQGLSSELRPEEALVDSQFGRIDVATAARDPRTWLEYRCAPRNLLVSRETIRNTDRTASPSTKYHRNERRLVRPSTRFQNPTKTPRNAIRSLLYSVRVSTTVKDSWNKRRPRNLGTGDNFERCSLDASCSKFGISLNFERTRTGNIDVFDRSRVFEGFARSRDPKSIDRRR